MRKKIKYVFLFKAYLYFSILLPFKVGAATQQPIRVLNIDNGLSNNSVTCITKDKYGFMWMGTYDGLNRYDGYTFKVFRNIWGDKNSLVNNHIKSINACDGRIYVGTEKGLMFFDYADSRFHALYCYNEQHQPVKIGFNINEIVADRSGNVFVTNGTYGFLKFGKTDTIGKEIPYDTNKQRFNTLATRIDNRGTIWVLVSKIGLGRYDAVNEKIKIVAPELAYAGCMTIDGKGKIIAGSGNELFMYDPVSLKTTKLDNGLNKLTSNNIFSLTTTKNGDIWVATNGGGIKVWNPSANNLTYINAGETPNSLRSGAVDAVYEDDESRIWIATLRGGVNIIDRKPVSFHLFAHDAFNKNSVINNFILSFCEDKQHNVWVGTDGGGLNYWNTRTNTFETYIHQDTPGTISSNFVVSILNDYTNKIWVATFNGGIDAFDNVTRRFKHYSCYNQVDKKEERNFWKLYEDSQHRLWAASTWGGALFLYNRNKDQFELFDNSLVNIHALFEDHAGNLWAGNYINLIKIDVQHKKHHFYFIGQAIRAITEDSKRNLWVGTEGGGLLQYDTNTYQYKRYTESAGLPSNTILNILIDNGGNLWCSTYNGLSNFNVTTKKIINYNASDGLQSNQFNYNAALKLASGKMLFGGIKGFNFFSPDSIAPYAHQPRLMLSDFTINNVSIERDSTYEQKQPLNELKEITIPFNQATLNISYTALEYSFPEKISYAYYLEGWDHGWNYVGKLKSAYFSRLNEGTYTLKIRATNTEGQWAAPPIAIKIIVLPPWYRTWWAFLIYLSLVFAIAYAFYNYRVNQAKLRFKVKLANLQVEKEKELNEKKLTFFTNVSHEFRTPLTLIINPIKDLLNQSKGNIEELSTIYRNARRLLGLVDHLLLFRKTESENTQLKVSKLNFVSLCKEVYSCFIQQAKIKHLHYSLESGVENMEVYGDLEKIEIALFNLISNAIKFTPDHGTIRIIIEQDDVLAYFKIMDSGIGINADVGDRLFDKFYQAKDKNYFRKGFGIGLYLVKVFIESHKGNISYSNNPNGGTTFLLALLKGKAHFSEDAIVDDAVPDYTYVNELIDDDNKDAEQEEDLAALELFSSAKYSLIVIDDNDQIRSYIKKIFTPGYIVMEAQNGIAGLELIKKHMPDVIISDIVMDGLSGLDLCRIIKEDQAISHIPVILLTGDTTPDIMLKSIEEGAIDFLRKPFDKELLIARVKSVLRNKTELQNYFYKEVTKNSNGRSISQENKDFLNNCISVIEHYFTDDQFDVYVLAKEIGISYPTLFKRLKGITGQSVNNFIRFVRLRKAAELLIQTNRNVNETAFQVGFSDVKYFREQFFKQYGVNPSEFIKKHRASFQISYRMNEFEKNSSK
jgi:signal transduction histidine kinase/ligand-binding sensor domain-containing protein/DNA-binding response OmpR family regulator